MRHLSRMTDLAETYQVRARECRHLAAISNDPILINYLLELAEALELEATRLRSESLPRTQPFG